MRYENRTFESEDVVLDDNEYYNCTFRRCTIVYRGIGRLVLSGNHFDAPEWRLEGPASNTLMFLTDLYHNFGEVGRGVVEATFENIRRGHTPPGGPTDGRSATY